MTDTGTDTRTATETDAETDADRLTDVDVAPAAAADAGEILTVQRAAYLAEAQLYGNPLIPPLTESLAGVEVAIAGGGVLVARVGSRVVGAVRGQLSDGVCHIGRLCVAPDVQRRGVGSLLLDSVEARFAARAASYALFTGSRSAANLALYARHGYVVTRTEPDHDGFILTHLVKAGGPA